MPNPGSDHRMARGTRVLVTGATGGLGTAIVHEFAARDALLVLTALPDSGLPELAGELRGRGHRVAAVPTDLQDPDAPARLDALARSELGGDIQVLVHAAGIERVGRFELQTVQDLESVLGVNLLSAMHLARLLIPGMLRAGWGRLVFVSSLSAKVGPAYTGAYAASKAGLGALARTLRAEYRGRGVSASVVIPGFVGHAGMYARARTQTGFRDSWILRTVEPEDVARGVLAAVARDSPEVLIQPGPTRLMLALGELLPRMIGQRLALWAGADRLFGEWADARALEQPPGAPPAPLGPAPEAVGAIPESLATTASRRSRARVRRAGPTRQESTRP